MRLIGSQYFLIFQYHPVAILGFLQLEKHHPQEDAVERLIEKSGLPEDGFRQMILHTEVDIGHAEELDHVLDSLEPTEEQGWVIGVRPPVDRAPRPCPQRRPQRRGADANRRTTQVERLG